MTMELNQAELANRLLCQLMLCCPDNLFIGLKIEVDSGKDIFHLSCRNRFAYL